MISAFGVEHGEPVSKDFGDKVTTGLATAGGMSVGSGIGSHIGARSAGTTMGQIRTGVQNIDTKRVGQVAQRTSNLRVAQGKSAAPVRTAMGALGRSAGKVQGFKAASRGGLAGAAIGGGLALAGMAMHHSNKNKMA